MIKAGLIQTAQTAGITVIHITKNDVVQNRVIFTFFRSAFP